MTVCWQGILATLNPYATCALCEQPSASDTRLCSACASELPYNLSVCRHCALPLPSCVAPGSLCGDCQRHPSRIPMVRAALRFETPVDHMVRALKFARQLHWAPAMTAIMLQALRQSAIPMPGLVVPVPLHPRRLRERGFNQAVEIARPLARRLQVRFDHGACIRTRDTQQQSGLSAKQRRKNVRGAFTVIRPLRGRRVAIVDDVVTTGNTVAELARAIYRAGAGDVEVWALARAAAP